MYMLYTYSYNQHVANIETFWEFIQSQKSGDEMCEEVAETAADLVSGGEVTRAREICNSPHHKYYGQENIWDRKKINSRIFCLSRILMLSANGVKTLLVRVKSQESDISGLFISESVAGAVLSLPSEA